MGFLSQAIEQQAEAALVSAARSGEVSFLCIRCDRVSTDPEGVKASLCGTCRKWIAAVRLYPLPLIWVLAVFNGPFVAGTLAALSWKRIGDIRKAQIVVVQLVACLAGLLFYGPFAFLPPVTLGGLLWLFVTAAVIGYATAGLGPLLTAHRSAGGRQGNFIMPVLVALALAAPGLWIWYSAITAIIWGG